MAKKKKPHYRHTGKLIPVRDKAKIQQELAVATEERNNEVPATKVGLDYFRQLIETMKNAELELCEGNREAFLTRTMELAECMAWMQLLESHWTNADGTKRDVSPQDAEFIVFHAIRLGGMIERCKLRVLEPFAVEGMLQTYRGAKLSENKEGFEISRSELLNDLKQMQRRYPHKNQKELTVEIGKSYGVSGETIRKHMQSHKIKAVDYKTT
jgi:hypothetical protein